MPGIFGGAMLAFALSIDDFVISNFNSGTTVTFPLYIFGAAQRGIPVEVNVIAMMLFGVTVVAMGFAPGSSAAPKRWRGPARAGWPPIRVRQAPGHWLGTSHRPGRTPHAESAPPFGACTERPSLAADVEADQLRDLRRQGGADAGRAGVPASSASSLAWIPRRIASPPIQWKGSGGTRGGEGSTKASREGSSRRSRASEASVRPTMCEGPTPLPV